LARHLNPFGISPGTIRLETGETPKGYSLSDFQDAFARYLPSRSATAPQTRLSAPPGLVVSATNALDVADNQREETKQPADCGAVADESPDCWEEVA